MLDKGSPDESVNSPEPRIIGTGRLAIKLSSVMRKIAPHRGHCKLCTETACSLSLMKNCLSKLIAQNCASCR